MFKSGKSAYFLQSEKAHAVSLFQLQCLFGTNSTLWGKKTHWIPRSLHMKTEISSYNENTVSSLLAKISLISRTDMPVKPCLPAGSTLVKGMNLASFQPLLLYLICLNGDMSLPSTHADSFSSELTQTRDLSSHPPQPAQTNYAWEKRGEKSLSFYISIFAREAGRQAVWNVNAWLSSLWLMWDHSDGCTQRYNEHTHTDFASGWGSRVQP